MRTGSVPGHSRELPLQSGERVGRMASGLSEPQFALLFSFLPDKLPSAEIFILFFPPNGM